jgi:hypothetical protein
LATALYAAIVFVFVRAQRWLERPSKLDEVRV